MNLTESFRIAISSLVLNRMRAILTALGIVIGVAAVTSLMSLGRGVQSYVTSQFEGMNVDLLTVMSSRPSSGIMMRMEPLTTQDVEALSDPAIAPDVKDVTAVYNVTKTVSANNESVSISVVGAMTNYADINRWYPMSGTFFTDEDIETSARVVLLGTTLVEDLYGDASFDPTGLSIQIGERMFTVTGVMEEQDGGTFMDPNETALIPITTAQTRLTNARVAGGGYQVSNIQVQVQSQEVLDQAISEVEAYFMDAHDIDDPENADFQVMNGADMIESMTQVTGMLTIFLSVVAGISLLVGGIGVMNIMLVSVSERTREIGLRKAVGAKASDILGQFLIESILLSLIGGILGIVVGWLVMKVGGTLIPDLTLTLTADVALLATGISSFVGIFFGLYPANRAARMHPIDALRFE